MGSDPGAGWDTGREGGSSSGQGSISHHEESDFDHRVPLSDDRPARRKIADYEKGIVRDVYKRQT